MDRRDHWPAHMRYNAFLDTRLYQRRTSVAARLYQTSQSRNKEFITTMLNSIFYVDNIRIHGKGLFARTFINAGEVIGILEGEYTQTDGDHVLWLDENTGFRVRCDLRYINHSDTPNAAYYDNLEVCAVRDIRPGEEITHDYGLDWQTSAED